MIYALDSVIYLLNKLGLDYLSLQFCRGHCIPVAVPDPYLEIRGVGGGWPSRPLDKGGGAQSPNIFLALPASVWSKNIPPLDLPLCNLCCWGSTRVRVKMLKKCLGDENAFAQVVFHFCISHNVC